MFFSSIYWNFLKQNTISTFFEALNRYNHQNSQDIPPPPSFPLVISKVVLGLATATTHFQQNALFPTFCIFSLISPFSHSAVDETVEIFSQKAGKHFKTSCRFSFYLFTSLQIDNTSVFQYSSFFPFACMERILQLISVKNITFKSSYNWFNIDILRLLQPPTAIFSHVLSHLNYFIYIK